MADMAQSTNSSRPVQERKIRPQKDQIINCPRCNSTNTKFCYYNNYSLSQPRYFCKTCRRYWTEGGTLRNVPVGGGSRKNKKTSSSSIPTISTTPQNGNSTQKFPDLNPLSLPQFPSQNPKTHHDLNLGFPPMQNFHGGLPHFLELAKVENRNSTSDHHQQQQLLTPPSSSSFSTLELLNTGIASRELSNSFVTPVSDLNGLYTSGGFPFQEMKPPSLQFSLEGIGSGYEEGSNTNTTNDEGVQENVGKFVFPFGGFKQNNLSTNEVDDQVKGQQGNSAGYWSGMLGGGSW